MSSGTAKIMTDVDQLFNRLQIGSGEFVFDENVANVFDDMISRSVPLYAESQQLVVCLARVQLSIDDIDDDIESDPVRVIDLGCSTGASLLNLAENFPSSAFPHLELVGVDNSQPMLDRLRQKADLAGLSDRFSVHCADILDFEFSDASLVLMNYTLQFIPVEQRFDLLSRIHRSMKPGGKILVSEKFMHGDPQFDRLLIELYFEYKRRNGYSELEISRKRDALENVLVPFTVEENERLLLDAGFHKPELLLKWFNFGTIMAQVTPAEGAH